MSVFEPMKGKWICRTPQEIAVLFIRLLFDSRNPKDHTQYKDEGERAVSALRKFLSFLLSHQWKSRTAKKPEPPFVPKTLCFDETSKRIGASKPTWPRSAFSSHKWIRFIVSARDARVEDELGYAALKRAQDHLDRIAGVCADEPIQGGWHRWTQLRQDLERQQSRLDACNQHVWQAIDAQFDEKDQCPRCRCYYSGVRVARDNDENEWTSDTKVSIREGGDKRPPGPCAESCLYLEELISRRESRDRGQTLGAELR